ncbi:hypothetical protein DVH21_16990 [Micromonospora aurantiaca]|uniref:Uncharacterized protein n=1 Tax=Micromonospora aurantiaca (nom. illeg.) TaxID=47850 RepID=A0A6N3K4F7_9ACTN|nr:hypothetical protein DVH21_16990 [Micromonospora aurantiaca]
MPSIRGHLHRCGEHLRLRRQAWFAQLSADGWTLLEPYVFDERRHMPGDVAATVGTFRPTRTS